MSKGNRKQIHSAGARLATLKQGAPEPELFMKAAAPKQIKVPVTVAPPVDDLPNFSDEEDEEMGHAEDDGPAIIMDVDEKVKGDMKNKLSKINSHVAKPGVVYLGHIPFGFHELQMQGFF